MAISPASQEEARVLASIISGKTPEDITNFIVIVSTEDDKLGIFTDQCMQHSLYMLSHAIQAVIDDDIEDEHMKIICGKCQRTRTTPVCACKSFAICHGCGHPIERPVIPNQAVHDNPFCIGNAHRINRLIKGRR